MRTSAPLLPVRMERRSDGDHELIIEPEVKLPTDGDGTVTFLTRRINEIVAKWVEQRPGHWMWLHRRFKV
jgi:Kdo2-lipid IVA lauroyltransferase/acyltransferase